MNDTEYQELRTVVSELRQKSDRAKNKLYSGWAFLGGAPMYLAKSNAYEDAADMLEERLGRKSADSVQE